MSYILDALRKAEAERQLGSVPNLHAQAAVDLTVPAAAPRVKFWLIGLPLLLACIACLLVWIQPWQRGTDLSPAVATAAPAPQSAPAVAGTETEPRPGTVAAPPSPPAADEAPAKPVAKPAKPVKPVKPESKTRGKQTDPPSAAPQPPTAKPSTPPVPMPATDPAANGIAVGKLEKELAANPRNLPENMKRDLPSLTIGGYVYSENPRDRQLLVNKRLIHEGEEAAPGVMLEKMLPQAAIFNFKGYRYQISY